MKPPSTIVKSELPMAEKFVEAIGKDHVHSPQADNDDRRNEIVEIF
ncbi:MAG: hypothetical protein U1F27_07110 [Turneriella sp.]